jgi:hypothetical protein
VAAWAAAAAALLLVASLPLRDRTGPGDDDDAAIRGSSIQQLSPIGAVRSPLTFEWASPVKASRFTIEVREPDGRTILQAASETQSWQPTPEQQSRFDQGRDYEWQVTGFDGAGSEIIRAPWQRFRVGSPQ